MTRGAATEAVVALLLGVILLTVGAAVTEPGPAQPDLRPSSYVNDPAGTRALHELLLEYGARPERLLEGPTGLVDPNQTVVVIGPSTAEVCHRLGLRIDGVAAEHTLAGLVAEIELQVTERPTD